MTLPSARFTCCNTPSTATETPEYQPVLNKLFCGIVGGVPIIRGIDITDKEKDVIEQMLNGVIGHWSALGKTSIAGLRETFLQRQDTCLSTMRRGI
jgi:hypothetical protein